VTATTTGAVPVLIDGRYRLRERTGSRPSAQVWRSVDERLCRTVEVTIYDASVTPSEFAKTALGVMARTVNPGLVTILDAGDDLLIGGTRHLYAVAEPIDAPTLERLCRSETLQPATLAAIGSSVAATLAFLHAQGLAHGNLDADVVLVPFESERAVLDDPPPRCATKLAGLGTAALLGRAGCSARDDLQALGRMLRAALGSTASDPPVGWAALLSALDGPTPLAAAAVSAQLATLAMTSGPAAAGPTPARGGRPRARHARPAQRRWRVLPIGAR
jgi:serine/threonine protein kinase